CKQDKETSELLKTAKVKPVYKLHGECKDRNWNTIQEFNNVIPAKIGLFFSKLARMNGANRFMLMATTVRANAKIPFVTQQSVMKYRHDVYVSENYNALDEYNSNYVIRKRQSEANVKLYRQIIKNSMVDTDRESVEKDNNGLL
ncbi:MAG: hypothetical protein IJV00_02385, partial [Clostridia bacterium]|nr:hypothetical protein [Clostridia bacterium]